MPLIRPGDKVCMIMSMNIKGVVLSVSERSHKTAMVDGPLSNAHYAKIQVTKAPLGTPPVIECRLGDLMLDDSR
jgi:hypothetical protein